MTEESGLQRLLDEAPCGLAVLDLHGKIMSCNAGFRMMVGKSEAEISQLNFRDLLTLGGKLFYETQFTPTLLLRHAMSEIALDLKGPDGHHIPVLINASLLTGDHAQQVSLAIFAVKQRHLYEKELLRARKEFEQIAEVVRRSSDAILRLTADGIVQSWNAGASQIFGISSERAVGKGLASLFEGEDEDGLKAAIADLRRGKQTFVEMRATRADGHGMDLALSMTPHLEPPGILVAFSAIIRDVTNRKLAERALLQNEKLASVGRLASSIAHEINNPLEAITNLLYLLQMRAADDATRILVTSAQKELDRVTQVTAHTLRFHKQSTNRTETNLSQVGGSILALYQVRFQNCGIAVVNDSEGASPLICFEGELRQILFALVSNAFDAMRGGGRLIFRCRNVAMNGFARRGVKISVADNGTGMSKETLKQIFEPFFSTKGIGGTGLGLWIAEGLVKKNGGSIRVRSHMGGTRSGTVVSMVFPQQPLQSLSN